jgi:hypothetical protein
MARCGCFRIQVSASDPVEELEPDTAAAQRLIHRGDHHIAHPGGHLQKNAPMYGTALCR